MMADDGEGEDHAPALAALAGGPQQVLPILPAIIALKPLLPQGADGGHKIGEDQRCARARAQL